MHDELIERRLRAALHDEAATLPFTITSAELERRVALRGRSNGNRRLTLLVAAALAIGAVGAGALLSGLSIQRPTPTAPVIGVATERPVSTSNPTPFSPRLPTLDALLGDDLAGLVVAQAHGAADGSAAGPAGLENRSATVVLGNLEPGTRFAVSVACLGADQLELGVPVVGGGASTQLSPIDCDGATVSLVIDASPSSRKVDLRAALFSSWRVVVRRLDGSAGEPTTQAPVLAAPTGHEKLIDMMVNGSELGTSSPDSRGRVLSQLPSLPAREGYTLTAWCAGGEAMRYIHGDQIQGVFVEATGTEVPCDGVIHEVVLGITEPNGSQTFVQASPESVLSIVVSGPTPPVSIVEREPGWQLIGAHGPELSFETHFVSISDAAGGPLRIVAECAGPPQDIEVSLEIYDRAGQVLKTAGGSFTASCSVEGTRTSATFEGKGTSFTATTTAPAGTWTTMTILQPDPSSN